MPSTTRSLTRTDSKVYILCTAPFFQEVMKDHRWAGQQNMMLDSAWARYNPWKCPGPPQNKTELLSHKLSYPQYMPHMCSGQPGQGISINPQLHAVNQKVYTWSSSKTGWCLSHRISMQLNLPWIQSTPASWQLFQVYGWWCIEAL